MHFPPLPLAETTNGVTKLLGDFGIQWPFLIAQIINFTVVAFILWKFAFKPVMATIDARQSKIESGLQYADEMKAKLAAARQASDAQLRDAQLKGQQIVAETQKAAKEWSDRQQKESSEKAAAILVKAQAATELEKKKMLAEARTEIARLVVATTQRVLAQQLSEADRSRYNESAAKELTSA